MAAAGAGGGVPPIHNIHGDFINTFGKYNKLKPNVKQKFKDMLRNPSYANETEIRPLVTGPRIRTLLDPVHALTSGMLPAKMVDDVIKRKLINVREVIELLTYARALLHETFNFFLMKNEEVNKFQNLKEYVRKYKAEQIKYLSYQQHMRKIYGEDWLQHAIYSPEPSIRRTEFIMMKRTHPEVLIPYFTEYGGSTEPTLIIKNLGNQPIKLENVESDDYVKVERVRPEYEIQGLKGKYGEAINPEYEDAAFLAALAERQNHFREMRRAETPELFNLPIDFFMGILTQHGMESLAFMKNMYRHLLIQINKLEDAKKEAMKYIFKQKDKAQIDALINMRVANLQEIADKYGFVSANDMTLNALASQIPSATPSRREELLALIQPTKLPKIQNNLNRLRTIRQNAGLRRKHSRRVNKTKRR